MVSVRLLCFYTLNETARFQVLIAVATKSSVFLDITSCSQVEVNQHSRATYYLYLQGHGITCQARSAFCSLQVGCLLGLLFDTQEGSNIFLSNVG
jgi:hypothetical protein